MIDKESVSHTWDYCTHCKQDMIVCGKCGNSCCNGGYGELANGKECDACPSAYEMQSKVIGMSVLEKLSALEHEQWSHWTKHMLENLTPENIDRWKRQIETPYSELTEREKDSDRVWAREVLAIIHGEPK